MYRNYGRTPVNILEKEHIYIINIYHIKLFSSNAS